MNNAISLDVIYYSQKSFSISVTFALQFTIFVEYLEIVRYNKMQEAISSHSWSSYSWIMSNS